MKGRYATILLILTFTFWGYLANAQIRSTDIVLSISPQYPSIGQNINATLNSYAAQLEKAHISWLINNQEVNAGIGKKSFSFSIESSESATTLSAIIDTADGQSILKTMLITPAGIDMLWEAYNTYAPPFYKGKTLVPSQGKFKVVAMPSLINQGEVINANNLSYLWEKDNKVQSDSSGWGKNYFIFQNSYLDKENTVEVKASDISGGSNASSKITLKTTIPKIVFYENDPLLGVKQEKALNNTTRISSDGTILIVEPYFFSPKNINAPELVFEWFLNGKKTETPNPKNILYIKPEKGKSGQATVRLKIANNNTLFQEAEKQISVEF